MRKYLCLPVECLSRQGVLPDLASRHPQFRRYYLVRRSRAGRKLLASDAKWLGNVPPLNARDVLQAAEESLHD